MVFNLFKRKRAKKSSNLEDMLLSSDIESKVNFVIKNQYEFEDKIKEFEKIINNLNLSNDNQGIVFNDNQYTLSDETKDTHSLFAVVNELNSIYNNYNDAFTSITDLPEKKISFTFFPGIKDYLSEKREKIVRLYNKFYTFLKESYASIEAELYSNIKQEGTSKKLLSYLTNERAELSHISKLLLSFDDKILTSKQSDEEKTKYNIFSDLEKELQDINYKFIDLKSQYESMNGMIIDATQMVKLDKMNNSVKSLCSSVSKHFYFEKQKDIDEFSREISFVVSNSTSINAVINDVREKEKVFNEITLLKGISEVKDEKNLEKINFYIREINSALKSDIKYPDVDYLSTVIKDFVNNKKKTRTELSDILDAIDKSASEFVLSLTQFNYSYSLIDDLTILSDKIRRVTELKTKVNDYSELREQLIQTQQQQQQQHQQQQVGTELPEYSGLVDLLANRENRLNLYKEELISISKERENLSKTLSDFNNRFNELSDKITSGLNPSQILDNSSDNLSRNIAEQIKVFSNLKGEILKYNKDISLSTHTYEESKKENVKAKYLDKDLTKFFSSMNVLKESAERLYEEIDNIIGKEEDIEKMGTYKNKTDELKDKMSELKLNQEKVKESTSKSMAQLEERITTNIRDNISASLKIDKLVNKNKRFDVHSYLALLPVPQGPKLFNIYNILGNINRFNANKTLDSLPEFLSGFRILTDNDLMSAEQLSYLLKNAHKDDDFITVPQNKIEAAYIILDGEIESYNKRTA